MTATPLLGREKVEIIRARVPERGEETFDRQLIECLKYLSILSLTGGRRIPVTPEVDDIWHELIVQTKSYMNLCAALPGGRFIHHETITPTDYAARVGEYDFVREFVQWVPDYVQSFGPFTRASAQHWTVCQFLQETMGMSLAELNQLGMTATATAALPENSPWRDLGGPGIPAWLESPLGR